MAFSVEGNVYIATYLIYADAADDEQYRSWVHEQTAAIAARRRCRRLPRRHRLHPAPGPLPRPTTNLAPARSRSGPERDPDRRFASYLTGDPAGLNVHG